MKAAKLNEASTPWSLSDPLDVLTRTIEACWSIRNIWRPENFHYHHRLHEPSNHFEGWYFKVVDAEERQPYAFIVGVFLGEDRHAFVQVLDGRTGTSWYHRFNVRKFSASRSSFDVRIGNNRFHAGGIELDLDRSDLKAEHVIKGRISFGDWTPWPSSFFSPGAMGVYAFVPFIECNHGLLSLDHEISGSLEMQGQRVSYEGGRGYLEKDWGSSFPKGYTWTQSNHFSEPGIAVTAAVATSPWLKLSFRGFIVGFLFEGTVHCFRSYVNAVIESLQVSETHMHLRVRNRSHRLEIKVKKSAGAVLMAPYEGKMKERVAETMSSTIDLCFSTLSGARLYVGTGRSACLEIQGDLQSFTG